MSKVCPECGETFKPSAEVCPYDDSELEEESADEDRRIGAVIDGRFRIDELLGEGGMGRVYQATQLSVDRQVAVKLIRSETMQDRELEQRFYREAQVISDFSHPNIVRLIDFGEDDDLGVPYLAMEYIDGLVLTDVVEGNRLHPNLVLEVTSQVAAGLSEAHGAEIVHRDLKSENILLVPISPGGFQAKIIDFGIAFPQQTSESLTSTGAICGTPQYLSPQQARGEKVGPSSDLYSLGVIMFEMTTGLLPFEADSAFDIMVKHVQEEPPPLSEFIESGRIPPELEELIANLLKKRPEERPPSARSIREAVETIRSQAGWSPVRLDDGEGTLEEQLEPWVLEPADRDQRLVTEGIGSGQASDTGPVRPETGATNPTEVPETAPGIESADTKPAPEGAVSPETGTKEAAREPDPAVAPTDAPAGGSDGTARAERSTPRPGAESTDTSSRTDPGSESRPGGAEIGSDTAAGNEPAGESSRDASGRSTGLLAAVSLVLVVALGALGAAVYVLQKRTREGASNGRAGAGSGGPDAAAVATTGSKGGAPARPTRSDAGGAERADRASGGREGTASTEESGKPAAGRGEGSAPTGASSEESSPTEVEDDDEGDRSDETAAAAPASGEGESEPPSAKSEGTSSDEAGTSSGGTAESGSEKADSKGGSKSDDEYEKAQEWLEDDW